MDRDEMLKELLEVSKDNNRMLKKLVKETRLAYIWTMVKIALFAIPIVLGFLYIQPFLDKINTIYNTFGGNENGSIFDSGAADKIKAFFDSL